MAIYVSYRIVTQTSITPVVHTFATKAAAQHFLDTKLPKHARGLDIFTFNDEGKTEGRQRPTYAYTQRDRTDWWDANKRPFSDGYEREELASLTTVRRKKEA